MCEFISDNFYQPKGQIFYNFFEDLECIPKEDLNEESRKQIIRDFNSKSKIIYNSEIDEDTISNFVSKVYGKSDLSCYIYLSFGDKKEEIIVRPIDLFFIIRGKLELKDDIYSLLDKIIISYGSNAFDNGKDYEYKFSFLIGASLSLKIKIEKKSINVILLENNNDKVGEIIIQDNFLKNPIALKEMEDYQRLVIKLDKIIVYQMEENK